MSSGSLGCTLKDTLYIYVDYKEGEQDEAIEKVLNIVEDDRLASMLHEVYFSIYKGKYYSTSFNFAKIVNRLGLSSYEYNKILGSLVTLGALVKIDPRCYVLAPDIEITSKFNKKDKIKIDERT